MTTVGDILERRGLDPGRRHGREWRTVCHVHGGENFTSMSYRDDVWHCHACLAGGDVVALVAALDGVDRQTAAQGLRERSGRRSLRERSEARRRAREREQAEIRRRDAQIAWAAAVERRDDISGDVALIERMWQRDPEERDPITQRALADLPALYLRRDVAEADVWERWAACRRAS